MGLGEPTFIPCAKCGGVGCSDCEGRGFDVQVIEEERRRVNQSKTVSYRVDSVRSMRGYGICLRR